MIASLEHPLILPSSIMGLPMKFCTGDAQAVRGGTLRELLLRGLMPIRSAVCLFGKVALALGMPTARRDSPRSQALKS
jgi:hypothetical protein